MLNPRTHLPRPARLAVVVVLIYAFCWVKGWPRYYDDEELPPDKRHFSRTAFGPHHVDHHELVVALTTTATNLYTNVAPSLVYLNEADRDSLLLFSDIQAEVGSWPVFDVLWRYSQNFIVETKELGRYRAQVDHARMSIPMHKVKKEDPQEEARMLTTLQKYKILQSMAAAWEYRPDRKWYAFIDDETYINRPNVLDWLSQYDAESKHFFGVVPTNGVPDPFAAGGTSFILSQRAMQELFKPGRDLIQNWQTVLPEYTSALQLVISVLHRELEVEMENSWPGMSGFDPSSVPFSPTLWCEPVLMMHHVTAEIGSDLWKLEKDRTDGRQTHQPIRFADLWDRFMMPENLNDTRSDWDNLSSDPSNSRWNILFALDEPDPERAPNGEASAEACKESCEKSHYCMQWSYSSIAQKNWNENPQTKCHLSNSVRFGAHTGPEDWLIKGEKRSKTWKSGWRKDKFSAWAYHQRCQAQHQK